VLLGAGIPNHAEATRWRLRDKPANRHVVFAWLRLVVAAGLVAAGVAVAGAPDVARRLLTTGSVWHRLAREPELTEAQAR
jgi:hypothetical protein